MPNFNFSADHQQSSTPAVVSTGSFITRTASDTTTLSESTSRKLILKRLISDTKTLSDTPTRISVKVRTKTDTITLSESDIRRLTLLRLKTDTSTLTDPLSRLVSLGRTLSDTTTKSESINTHITLFRTRNVSDTTEYSDNLTRIVTLKRLQSDTSSLSESITRDVIGFAHRNLSDTIELSEPIQVLLSFYRTTSDSTTLSDTLIRLQTLKRLSLADIIDLSENILAHQEGLILIQISETIPISEILFEGEIVLRIPEDTTLVGGGGQAAPTQYIIPKTDDITLSESLIANRKFKRLKTDSIGSPGENIVIALLKSVRVLEAETVGESSQLLKIFKAIRTIVEPHN